MTRKFLQFIIIPSIVLKVLKFSFTAASIIIIFNNFEKFKDRL